MSPIIIASLKGYENKAVCFSNDKNEKRIGKIKVLPWQKGLERYFM